MLGPNKADEAKRGCQEKRGGLARPTGSIWPGEADLHINDITALDYKFSINAYIISNSLNA